jgi:hypothetical protein
VLEVPVPVLQGSVPALKVTCSYVPVFEVPDNSIPVGVHFPKLEGLETVLELPVPVPEVLLLCKRFLSLC